MNCEVLAIGTELLLGQVVDTNSSWIGEQLALTGIDCLYQAKVGDNPARIRTALREAVDRSDAVIVCGGLGPTQDDITRDVIAEVMGVPLHRDAAVEERIRSMFGSRGRDMPANNLRQADVPEGATVMAQQPGTAPGLICPVGDKVIYAVPGVPYEMKEMVEGSVLPDLARRAGVQSVIRSRTLRTWGHSESGIAEVLADRIVELDALGNPTIAFLASGIEGLKVRITAKADDDAAAESILEAEVAVLAPILGDWTFSAEDESMETVVLGLLRERGLTLAVAESVTGGLVVGTADRRPGHLRRPQGRRRVVLLGGQVRPAGRARGPGREPGGGEGHGRRRAQAARGRRRPRRHRRGRARRAGGPARGHRLLRVGHR